MQTPKPNPPEVAGLDLSPSVVHTRLVAKNQPELAYDASVPVGPWQDRLRPRLAACLGYDAMTAQPRCELNPRRLWKREHPLGTIEKLAFTTEPGADALAYLCLPKDRSGTGGGEGGDDTALPCFICLQGHSPGMHVSLGLEADETTPMETVRGERDFAVGVMRRGMAALCIEQRSFGQRAERIHEATPWANGCHNAAMHALMLGRTLAGERAFDVSRGIDLLATRPEIDPERLGVMGNSGGAVVSLYAAALDRRLAYAMPSCGFCTYAKSIMAIHHCADNYAPGLLRLAELADVAGLIAPRPLVAVAGKEDRIFPIDGVHDAFEHLQQIYDQAEASDQCALVVGDEGHRFYAQAAWTAMEQRMKAQG